MMLMDGVPPLFNEGRAVASIGPLSAETQQ